MCKQLFLVAIAGLLLDAAGVASGADDPGLVGWWKLNEGDGDVALDSSGRGVNGAITNLGGGLGTNGSVWVEDPERGMVLSFSGDDTAGGLRRRRRHPGDEHDQRFHVDGLVQAGCRSGDRVPGAGNDVMLGNRYGGTASPLQFVKFTPTKFEYYNDDATYANSITYPTAHPGRRLGAQCSGEERGDTHLLRNGKKVLSVTLTKTMDANPFYMGGDPQGERWRGCLSDVRLYERAVTEEEIFQIGAQLKARKPNPANGSLNVGMPLLQWTPGDTAMFHNVYLGVIRNLTEADLVAASPAGDAVLSSRGLHARHNLLLAGRRDREGHESPFVPGMSGVSSHRP